MPLISPATGVLLGLITTAVLIWFIGAAIAEGVRKMAKSLRGGRDAEAAPADVYLAAYEAWLDSGMEGAEPGAHGVDLSKLPSPHEKRLEDLDRWKWELKKQPKPDAPLEERKERLLLRWREDIQQALRRTSIYRPQLGDSRPSLEEYGLTLRETVSERRALYHECFDAFQSAYDAYERDYYQTHGRVPIHNTPAGLLAMEGNAVLNEPLPPRAEDFWLAPEDLQEPAEA